ncbi:hypothetical protein T4A_9238 [Trichinella pseudospiralis]|uniref:Uncharacterized protein n=1 Tax=Trichinella pseudospiralis TaxID=6337 RepID=A0A0V1KG82_TRIPS|nr:hypothetical protein T4A_9238 [Trichinella pseudospiralis]KRZ46265.1 hypothetical protein T4C_2019 [Trichinella pseudospiralis]
MFVGQCDQTSCHIVLDMTVQDKLFGHFFNQSTKKDPEQTGKYFKMLNDYLYLACAADMDRANGIFPPESKEEET